MHIGIAGNIGCGKTTLTRMLSEHYGWTPKYEAVTYNPYLEDYYKDIQRWSYNLETYFLAQRFQDLLAIAKSDDVIIQDRTIMEGVHIFVANNKAMGNLSDRDFDTYMQLFNLMMAISALFSALTGVLFIFHPDRLFPVLEFTIGGFSGRSMQDIYNALPAAVIVLICGFFLPRRVDLLSIGDTMAHSLGADVGKNRLFALTAAALAGALTTALAGLAGFTGLMAPHIAGKLTGKYTAKALLMTAPLTGAALMLTGDLAGRLLFAPREIPAGLPLAFAGAIFFLILLTGKSGDAE